MKLQNFAIIFLVIIIPLLMILSYYLDKQQETLTMQADYNVKLAESTKDAIKAFEINTVEWSDNEKNKRSMASAAINTFINSLANNLNITGTAKEYMIGHIPAVVLTTYDGYYAYTPAYTAITLKEDNGVQLFYDEDGEPEKKITTQEYTGGVKNEIIYEPAEGITGSTITIEEKTFVFVTDINEAKKEYKHKLNNKMYYADKYSSTTTNLDLIVNYTLDNKISIFGTQGTGTSKEIIDRTGYLVYFDRNNSNITGDLSNIKYNGTVIEPETLEEQIIYTDENDGNGARVGVFKYVYDMNNEKLYYDGENFFVLGANKKRKFLLTNAEKGDNNCRYKKVSILTEDSMGYINLYQLLNGNNKRRMV